MFTIHRAEAARVPSPGSHELSRFEGTALLVEDEPLVRMSVRHYLEVLGFEVLEAEGPDEALRLCEAHSGLIDLLVSDVVMPVMGGPKLATRIRQIYANVCVLFISANPEAIGDEGRRLSHASVLEKPFGKEELHAELEKLVEQTSQRPP